MPLQKIKIPVVSPPYPTLDGIELDSNSISINDCYIDEAKFLVKRPGLSSVVDLGTASPVDGLAWWEGVNRLVAVSAGKCFLVDVGTGIATEIGTTLQLRNRPTIDFTKINGSEYMAIANGGLIHYSINGGSLSQVTDPSAPSTVTHVTWVNNRLVANEVGTDRFWWSAQFDPSTWDGDFATAEGEPDAITALYKSWNEVVLFGTNTVEFWYTTGDATAPFARMQGTQLNQGTISPDAITFDDETSTYYFLDSERNVNALTNRSTTSISAAIDKQLQAISDVSEARLSQIKIASHKFLVLTFPDADTTYVYDLLTGFWFQWGRYNTGTAEYEQFQGRSLTWASTVGKNYAGSSENDGLVLLVSPDVYQDNGNEIRAALKTGWIHGGDHVKKTWNCLLFRLKRQPTEGASYFVRVRKDTVGSNEIERTYTNDLGTSANVPFVQRLHHFGQARALQLEIYCSDNVPFIVGDFELEYRIGRR